MTKNEQLDFIINELSPTTIIPSEVEEKWRLTQDRICRQLEHTVKYKKEVCSRWEKHMIQRTN